MPLRPADPRMHTLRPAERWAVVAGSTRTIAIAFGLTMGMAWLVAPAADGATITFRAAGVAGNMGGTTLVIPKPAGVVSGDFLLAAITVRDNPGITPPSADWTLVRKDPLVGGPTTVVTQAVYWHTAGSTEPATYTWTFSTSQLASGGISAYIGVDSTAPINAMSGATGTGNTLTAPSVITTVNDALIVGLFGVARSTGISPPTGMTERFQQQAAGGSATTKTTTESS